MEYHELNIELKNAGVPDMEFMDRKMEPVEVLQKISSKPYVDILLKYFPKLHGNEKGMVVRALTEKGNYQATMHLLDMFENRDGITDLSLWTAGNAIFTIDDERSYPSIIKICKNKSFGIARQMLVGTLAKIKSEEAYQVLIENLDDETVRGHAIEALGKFGDVRAIQILEGMKTQKGKFEDKTKKDAIVRLSKRN